MNKNNVPKIRFPGFTEPWEQRRLSEVLKNRRITMKQNSEYHRLAFASGQGVIEVKERKTNNRDQLIKDEFDKKYLVTEYNDIVYNPANLKYGAIDRNKLGKGLISPIYVTFTTDEIPAFIERIVKSENFKNKALRFEEGSVTKRQSVNVEDLLTLEIMIAPNKEEQKKIGDIFDSLDNLIFLHQRKLEHLKKQKKGLLQKMFPKAGAKVPEIRFPEFTGDWEQRKLGEISDKVTEKNINNTYNETFTNSAEYGIIPQRDFFEKDISNIKNLNGYYVVRNDDFVYNPRISNFAPVGPIKRNKLLKTGVMSPLYYVFRTRDIDRTYLEHYFDTTYWHMFMKLNGDSGARSDRFAIKDSVFVEMPIPFPKLEEQKKIGMFFEEFDNLITLHQRKLEHLQKQKKALLQQMFI